MTDYTTWSLERLKAAAEQTHPGVVGMAASLFRDGATAMVASQDDFMSTINSLQSAWKGKAAQAAITSAQSAYAEMELARSSAADSRSTSDSYESHLTTQKQQVAQIQNVDTSWGSAAKSGWWGGLTGVGVAKMQQQQKYDAHRDQAAKVVQQMDTDGATQASTMKSMTWPTGSPPQGSPDRNLPPVPHSTTSPGGGSGPGSPYPYSPGGGGRRGPSYTPVVVGPATNPDDNQVLNGPKGHHPPGGPSTTPQGGGSPNPDIPTVPQGGGGNGPGGGTPGSGPVAEPVPTTGAPSGGGAAAAVLGGAGLLGAGAVGGRGLLGGGARGGGLAGETEGRIGGRGAGLAEGEGGVRGGVRGVAGPAEGEGALRGVGSGSGLAEDGGVRPGARGLGGGLPAEEELGAARGSALRGATGGFAGEPVAAEAGRFGGGYPMGGAGARRGGDDEEAPVPDYLVETDDVWGDGVSAAPPVIGE